MAETLEALKTEGVADARMRGQVAGLETSLVNLRREKERWEREVESLRVEIRHLHRRRDTLARGREPLPAPRGYRKSKLRAPVLCDQLLPAEVIYALVDPLDAALVRYIGRTSSPVTRYRHHCTGGTEIVVAWASELFAAGRAPLMLLVERCERADSPRAESYWIHHYKDRFQADLNRSIPRRVTAMEAVNG